MHLGILAVSCSLGVDLFGYGVWLPPVTLTSKGTIANNPRVVLNARHQGLAVWNQVDKGRNKVYGASWKAMPGAVGGQWGPDTLVETLSSSASARKPMVVLNDSGAGMAVWGDGDGVWAAGCTDGRWASPALISAGLNGMSDLPPHIGMDAVGNVLAVWQGNRADTDALAAARFSPTKGWAAPMEEPIPYENIIDIAVNAAGSAAVLGEKRYLDDEHQNEIQIGVQRFSPGAGWGPNPIVQQMADYSWFECRGVALGPRGQCVYTYGYDYPYSSPQGPNFVAENTVGSHWYLDNVDSNSEALAMDGADRTFVAWLAGGVPKVARIVNGLLESSSVLGGRLPASGANSLGLAVASKGMALAMYARPAGTTWSQVYIPGELAKAAGVAAGWQEPVLGPACRYAPGMNVALGDSGEALAVYPAGTGILAATFMGSAAWAGKD